MRKRMTLLWSTAITVSLIGVALAQKPPAEGEKADAPPKMPRVERMFNVMDTNKDGVISKEEFQSHFEDMPMQAGMGRDNFPQGPRFDDRGPQFGMHGPQGGFQRGGFGMPGGPGRGPIMGQGPMQYGGPPMFTPGPQGGFQRGGPGMPGGPDRGPRNDARGQRGDRGPREGRGPQGNMPPR